MKVAIMELARLAVQKLARKNVWSTGTATKINKFLKRNFLTYTFCRNRTIKYSPLRYIDLLRLPYFRVSFWNPQLQYLCAAYLGSFQSCFWLKELFWVKLFRNIITKWKHYPNSLYIECGQLWETLLVITAWTDYIIWLITLIVIPFSSNCTVQYLKSNGERTLNFDELMTNSRNIYNRW
jgi:hypothetical protein